MDLYHTLFFRTIGKRMLFRLSAEKAHHLAICMLKRNLVPAVKIEQDDRLRVNLGSLSLAHPVGLAAGFDKNAECLENLSRLGFSFVETGTVTPKAQTGNPKPRLFRIEESHAILNRLGFNNHGLEAYQQKLGRYQAQNSTKSIQIGANIGKNKTSSDAVADYITCFKGVDAVADYITVNISSPNTPGLRDLQADEAITALLTALAQAREEAQSTTPLFLKIAPDMEKDAIKHLVDHCITHKIDAMIVSNTTIDRDKISEKYTQEAGGISGAPLFSKANQALAAAYKHANGALPLIGVGGIMSGADAVTKIRLGATAIQLYTGLIYQGFELVNASVNAIAQTLEAEKMAMIHDLIGIDA